ncbi:alkaline phosphatase family protein [Aeribacillus alveayuensis]|uniref:AlkP superfamily pyrophosphatase or phosphodiesterase n=1 Tax=Aeribacillus alveayuensis TaxID=279215 RepID=A0ABT9VP16_9BACI|nr:putative AlkP superfamily pyrophosphatase or phosphodiesterase [Bacillus alveayuensis]
MSKKVIMLLIDSLMYPSLQKAVNEGKAPALQFFMDHGKVYQDVVSPFPTMSVNVDSSLLTGTYADKHQIPGLVWYNETERRLINYGSHIRELVKLGLMKSLQDIFFHLNNEHLSKEVKTIHEELADQGLTTASINTLIYRGKFDQMLKCPFPLNIIPSIKNKNFTKGAKQFTYGSFSKQSPRKKYSHFWNRYGFNDSFSAQEFIYLIESNLLPHFSIVYFPDMDKTVHKHGPLDTKGLQSLDLNLQKILNSFSTWEDALTNNIWILLGDNGQAPIENDPERALIDLRKLLGSYRIMKLREKTPSKEDEIVLAVNERMAYIYPVNEVRVPTKDIVKQLQSDDRIDVIAYKKNDHIHVVSSVKEGELIFKKGGPYVDPYNQSWEINGNIDILHLSINNNTISFDLYPDALARIYSSLTSHQGDYITVSAKPGFEFIGEGSPTHVGGASHGGLHKQDSLVPMIVTGTKSAPKYLRIIDLKDWILSLI